MEGCPVIGRRGLGDTGTAGRVEGWTWERGINQFQPGQGVEQAGANSLVVAVQLNEPMDGGKTAGGCKTLPFG